MPVPVITGVSHVTKPVDCDKTHEETRTVNGSTEDEEQMKSQDDCVEKGQDCLEPTRDHDVLELENDFEDITPDVPASANIETEAIPTIDIQTSNENSNGFVENYEEVHDVSCREGSSMVTTLRAVETVPCTSYSSSDDDDEDDDESEFFDANEYTADADLQSEEAKRYFELHYIRSSMN